MTTSLEEGVSIGLDTLLSVLLPSSQSLRRSLSGSSKHQKEKPINHNRRDPILARQVIFDCKLLLDEHPEM